MAESYRGFDLRPDPDCPKPGWWAWTHPDYDGPPDRRCGSAPSLDEARAQVDALLADDDG